MFPTGPRIPVREDSAELRRARQWDRVIWWIAASFVPVIAMLMIGLPLLAAPVSPRWIVLVTALWLASYVGARAYRRHAGAARGACQVVARRP
jgi:hypothetical protein